MRIISGRAGGRRLFSSPDTTRPTSDRVREALFNSLDHLFEWPSVRFLDLYSGSGAVGLEAASRGAHQVVLVEKNSAAVQVAKRNIRLVGIPQVAIIQSSVQAYLQRPTSDIEAAPFDIVFLDPPYDRVASDWPEIADLLVSGGWVAEGSLIVVERSVRDRCLPWPDDYRLYKSRKYGETQVELAFVEPMGGMAA